jgi:hypothetical protein
MDIPFPMNIPTEWAMRLVTPQNDRNVQALKKSEGLKLFFGKEVKKMPFGMGPAGWLAWPHMAYWMRYAYPWYPMPYWSPFPALTKEEEESLLQDQAKMLEEELAQINKRLEELKKEKQGGKK